MWIYEKKLEYPINIRQTNPKLASLIISQLGGPDGELAASMRYLNQRYAMPYREGMAVLTDIGTEELAHLEMVSTIIYQLTRSLSVEEIESQGFGAYYIDHTTGLWPQAASGEPFTSNFFQSKGDPITDLNEDLAAEQKARTTYDNILRLLDDPDVIDPIRFLRQRELVHYQRFGETLRLVQDRLDSRNFYAFNPAFDRSGTRRDGNAAPDAPGEAADTAPVGIDGNTGERIGVAAAQNRPAQTAVCFEDPGFQEPDGMA
ncbi:MAG: manganese catalase family protein [Clostridia bacterium]|nr:manganese catalase family protein [Clostridia bacterium]